MHAKICFGPNGSRTSKHSDYKLKDDKTRQKFQQIHSVPLYIASLNVVDVWLSNQVQSFYRVPDKPASPVKTRSVGTNTHAVSDPQEQQERWEIPDFPGAIELSSQLWREVWSLAGSAISILMSYDTVNLSSIQIPDLNGQDLKILLSSIKQQASFLSSGMCDWDLFRNMDMCEWRSLQKDDLHND